MNANQRQFLRNLHMLRTVVAEVMEDGWLADAGLGELTFVQMNLLKFIGKAKPVGAEKGQNYWSISDVSHQLSVSNAAASKAVARLVNADLVESIVDPADARARQVRTTRKGKRALARFEAVSTDHGSALCESVGELAVKRWNKSVHDILSALLGSDAEGVVACLRCGVYDQSLCIAEKFGSICQLREETEG